MYAVTHYIILHYSIHLYVIMYMISNFYEDYPRLPHQICLASSWRGCQRCWTRFGQGSHCFNGSLHKQITHVNMKTKISLQYPSLLLFLKIYIEKRVKWEALMGTRCLPVIYMIWLSYLPAFHERSLSSSNAIHPSPFHCSAHKFQFYLAPFLYKSLALVQLLYSSISFWTHPC